MSVILFIAFLMTLTNELMAYAEQAAVPSLITALSGSCVQIPCTFDAPNVNLNNATSIFGFWTKTESFPKNLDYLMVFNGRTNITKGFSHIEILGNLRQHECTTVFYNVMKNHSDKYYFRVETQPGIWVYTYRDNPVNISVSDVPQPPILKPTDLKEVMEGSPVTLSCSAEAPCPEQPPTISWSDVPESANITTQLQEKPNKTQSVLSLMSFEGSYKDHRKNISCSATYPRNTLNDSTVETTVMLQILFPPKETHIIINASASVSVGTNVTLTCESQANPSKNMNYTWYKRGQDKELGFGEQVVFTVNGRSGGLYFCTAKNELGSQMSEEIQLTVTESAIPLIAGCVGGISALLLLFILATLLRWVQKAKATRKSTVSETDHSDQSHAHIETVYVNDFMTRDSTYINDFMTRDSIYFNDFKPRE